MGESFHVNRFKLPPVPVFLTMAIVAEMAAMAFSTMSAVYRITEAGLNPLQLILVGTVSGIDGPARRRSHGCSRRCLQQAPFYDRRLCPHWNRLHPGRIDTHLRHDSDGTGCLGIWIHFCQRSLPSLVGDELKDDSKEPQAVFVKATKYESFGALIGIGLSAALATIYVGFSLIAGGVIFLGLAVFVAVSMQETGFTPRSNTQRSAWQSMTNVLRTGIRAVSMSRVLMALIAIEVFFGMSSEPFDRLWAKHALEVFEFPMIFDLDPIVWFGVIQAAGAIITIVAISSLERLIPVDRSWAPRVALSIFNATMIGATLTFALTGTFGIAIAMVVVVYVLHRVTWPFAAAWINRNCESEYRATVFSLHEQANSFGQVFFGPGMGLLATVRGLRLTLIGVSFLLIPPQLLYLVRESPRGSDEAPKN